MGNSKRWTISVLVCMLISVLLIGTFTYITDPLGQFRTDSDIFTYWEYSELYSNPGIARNYEYDSVLVGTSMVQNTDVKECNELFDCNMVKLPYAGGTAYNMKIILDICFDSDNDIKTVYWGLDEHQIFADHETVRHTLPEYLYKTDVVSRLSYLFNININYQYTLTNILHTLKGDVSPIAQEGDKWGADSVFSKDVVLSSYQRLEQQTAQPENYYEELVNNNLEYNIIPLIEENPDTEFVFFMAPYSILFWDNEIQAGTLDATIHGVSMTIERLLGYDNVKIYFFQDDTGIITNLDNYKDYTHYRPEINSYMMNSISEDNCRLTLENYKVVLGELKSCVEEYDYNEIFN